ncbi:hypothetical protein VTH06DRAFT_7467 [Thermothelomyces fergusii]
MVKLKKPPRVLGPNQRCASRIRLEDFSADEHRVASDRAVRPDGGLLATESVPAVGLPDESQEEPERSEHNGIKDGWDQFPSRQDEADCEEWGHSVHITGQATSGEPIEWLLKMSI